MQDLFDEGAGFFTDGTLLIRLATEKLDGLVEAKRGAGWKWVKAERENDYGPYYPFVHAVGFDGDDEDEEQDQEPVEAGFTDEEKARSGVRIRIGQDGTPVVERGLVHPDDQPRAVPPATKAEPDPMEEEYPSLVVQDLTAHRTAALRVELAANAMVALAVTVHALATPCSTGRGSARASPSRPKAECSMPMSARTARPMPGSQT